MHFVTVFTLKDWFIILVVTLLALAALYFWLRSKARKIAAKFKRI